MFINENIQPLGYKLYCQLQDYFTNYKVSPSQQFKDQRANLYHILARIATFKLFNF